MNNEDLIQMEPSNKEAPEDVNPEEGTDSQDTDNIQNKASIHNQKGVSGQASQEAIPGEIQRPPVRSLFLSS